MNYALGYGFNVNELAENFPKEKLLMKPKDYREYTGNHKKEVINRVFVDSLKLVLEDVINNDVTFELPSVGRKADIHMIKIKDADFIKARKNGKFSDVDYLQSMFTGYQPGLFIHGVNTRTIPIYLDNNLKQQLLEKVNSGHTYG